MVRRGNSPRFNDDYLSATMMEMKNETILDEQTTAYGHLKVIERDGQRILLSGKHIQSAVYLDPSKRNELVFPYMQRFSYAFAVNPKIKETLLIGGGGFCYPRYYLAQYPDKYITVAEIDSQLLKMNRRFFDVEVIMNERMKIINDDGFQYLAHTEQKFDLIINDAFLGQDQQGRDEKNTALVHSHLQPDGIYLINAAVRMKGLFASPYHRMASVLSKEFQYTAAIQCSEDSSAYDKQNVLFAASDSPLL